MHNKRRTKFINEINAKSIALFYSGWLKQKTNDQYYPFSVNRNFFYLTGIEQENVVLLVVKGQKNNDSYLFLDKIDPIKSLWDGETLSFEKAGEISQIKIENVRDIATLPAFINALLGVSRAALYGEVNNFYFDLERQNANHFPTPTEIIANQYKTMYPQISVSNSNRILARLRMSKDDFEVQETVKAIAITEKALEHLMKSLKPGANEFQMEAEYNYYLNMNNVTPSFDTIAASGKNGTILHYVDNNAVMKNNDLILFDLGVKYNNYCSDISRTYPVNGKFTDRQKQIYEIVLEANKKTIEWLKPGVTIKEFNELGKNILIKGLKKLGLIKEDSEISKYYYHSLGHYLGLDVHDVGHYDEVIPVGAIITVEPGLYIAEEGIGIRIEDNILITENGNVNLSKNLIKEIKDIENFMK